MPYQSVKLGFLLLMNIFWSIDTHRRLPCQIISKLKDLKDLMQHLLTRNPVWELFWIVWP